MLTWTIFFIRKLLILARSCGGGVLIERRLCSDNTCQGPSIRYISCNIEPCPAGTKDFRYEQCSQHNDDPLDGKYYKVIN